MVYFDEVALRFEIDGTDSNSFYFVDNEIEKVIWLNMTAGYESKLAEMSYLVTLINPMRPQIEAAEELDALEISPIVEFDLGD